MAEPQEQEKLVSQNSIYFLLTVGKNKYYTNLHILVELNNDKKLQKSIFEGDINLVQTLRKIKSLYDLYSNANLDDTADAIKKELLIEVAKILYLFG